MYDRTKSSFPSVPAPAAKESGRLTEESLAARFADCEDFQGRRIDFGLDSSVRLCLFWLDGLVSGTAVTEEVLRPLTQLSRSGGARDEAQCAAQVLRGGVYRCNLRRAEGLDGAADDLCHGCCVLLFPRSGQALSFEVRTEHLRAVSEPTLEKSLKGGKDAFVETLRVNTALVRQRIASPALKVRERCLGRKSRTRVAVLYLDGVAAPETLRELNRRLDRIDVDAVLATGILEEKLVDAPRSPFPQLLHTERPDRFAMHLTDGRIGLLVDGLPVGLVLPVTLAEFLKVTGDSSMHYLVATGLTLLRWLALGLAVLLPGFYAAVALHHPEMIPTRLLLSIIEAERDIPFSTPLELLSMLAAFSLLQEAGLRLPNPIGDTVSIIGALIVGQAAVDARLISPLAIIIVAISGIACYTLPSQDLAGAVKLCRLALLLAAILGGLYGVGLGLCLILLHLADLDSFGRSYTAPLSEGRPGGLSRLLLRPPKAENKRRDPLLHTPDRRRQA